MAIWVADTSPLIFLGTLERLDLLRQADRTVYIPQAVFKEVLNKQDVAAQRVAIAAQTWLKVQNVNDMRMTTEN
jgi:predicted nucleic acid-binding protein